MSSAEGIAIFLRRGIRLLASMCPWSEVLPMWFAVWRKAEGSDAAADCLLKSGFLELDIKVEITIKYLSLTVQLSMAKIFED